MLYPFKLYTVESVTNGHPDKICDQISDAILDECLRQDSKSRVAIEIFGGHGFLTIGGELTTNAKVDYEKIAQDVYRNIGYADKLQIVTHIVKQSPDIAQGVDVGGAGDQGIMYGYATDETPEYLPLGVILAHKLTKGLQTLRESKAVNWLRPDGKSQVTMEDDRIKTILVSCQHDESVTIDEIRQVLVDKLIVPIVGKIDGIEILVNPTGRFVKGGFEADTGLTGRKIMVDSYGGLITHGGGCYSGKDPTKVDRSGAYMARFVAKNIVANGMAKECLISIAYAIGRPEPVMAEAIDENGNSIDKSILDRFDFRPRAIIEKLNLQRPIYLSTASYGHFGKSDLPWEEMVGL
ncbi:MAG: methionine adenosyltransferase [Candidatus Parcubacteria bacterium]|nr:methionine adenosyltransferase [Candidatus Parcubacteria bacterium]